MSAQRRPGRLPRRHLRIRGAKHAQRRPGRLPRRHWPLHRMLSHGDIARNHDEGRGAYPGDTANSAKRGNRGETRAILGGGGLGDGMFLGNLHALGSIRVGETGASGKKLALTTLAPTWLHRITEGSQWVKAPKALPVRGVGFDRSAAWRLPSDQGSDTRLRNRDDCR